MDNVISNEHTNHQDNQDNLEMNEDNHANALHKFVGKAGSMNSVDKNILKNQDDSESNDIESNASQKSINKKDDIISVDKKLINKTNVTNSVGTASTSLEEKKVFLKHMSVSAKNKAYTLAIFDDLGNDILDQFLKTLLVSCVDDDSISDGDICRICFGSHSKNLLKLCDCKGSIAYVHVECIERWLKERDMDRCDICRHKFNVVRKPTVSKFRSLLSWLKHEDNQEDVDDLLIDTAVTTLFSPFLVLLTVSGYGALQSNAISFFSKDPHSNEFVFSVAGTLSTLTMIGIISLADSIGMSWLLYIVHKHYSRWHAWYRRSDIVKIVLSDKQK